VAENSKAGTVVGCFSGEDDDPGQTLSFFIVKSIDKLFEMFKDSQNRSCLRVMPVVSLVQHQSCCGITVVVVVIVVIIIVVVVAALLSLLLSLSSLSFLSQSSS
jgi:hypothetical protein